MYRDILTLTTAGALLVFGSIFARGDTFGLNCSGTSCAGYYHPAEPGGFPQVLRLGPPVDSERFETWLRVCDPRVVQDKYGVGRFVYAREGCEFGKTEW